MCGLPFSRRERVTLNEAAHEILTPRSSTNKKEISKEYLPHNRTFTLSWTTRYRIRTLCNVTGYIWEERRCLISVFPVGGHQFFTHHFDAFISIFAWDRELVIYLIRRCSALDAPVFRHLEQKSRRFFEKVHISVVVTLVLICTPYSTNYSLLIKCVYTLHTLSEHADVQHIACAYYNVNMYRSEADHIFVIALLQTRPLHDINKNIDVVFFVVAELTIYFLLSFIWTLWHLKGKSSS